MATKPAPKGLSYDDFITWIDEQLALGNQVWVNHDGWFVTTKENNA